MRTRGRATSTSERAFSQQVIDLAKVLGWRVYHTWLPIHSPAGFPDLVLLRPPRLIFAELKSDAGKTTPAQDEWLADLRMVEQAVALGGDRCCFDTSVANITASHLHISVLSPSVEIFLWRPVDFDVIALVLGRRELR